MTSKNRSPETDRDGNEDKQLLETEEYAHIAALLQGSQGLLGGQNLAQNTAARLALLEENFARICLVVGRLEQEILLLKGEASDEPLL